jgi:integrase
MGTRADNLDGSLKEVLTGKHAGKWRVQFTQLDELGKKQRIDRIFATKSLGREFLHGLRHGAKVEAAKKKKELTLGGWFDWLAEHDWPEELDEKTIAIRVGRFNKHVREPLGGLPLTKIDPLVIRTFYRQLREEGVGQATVHGIKANLVRVFNQAITPYGRVPASMANPFRLTLQSAPAREAVALTPEEARAAIESEKLNPKERAMLATFLLAGLRLSEQMALTKGQLLFDKDLIYIDRAVKLDKKGGQTVGLPKGNKKRLAVMCPTLKKILLEVTVGMDSDTFVWSSDMANQPRMKRSVYRSWDTLVAKAKLPSEMSPHDCRLTHINWIEKLMPEVSATTLKEHVGHAAEGVTEVNYTRPIAPAQKILRDSVEKTVFGRKHRGSRE